MKPFAAKLLRLKTCKRLDTFLEPCGFTLLLFCVAAVPAAAAGRVNLTVSAAVSLTESLQSVQALYRRRDPGISVSLNLGGSGFLEQQIEQGAPVDVFISASPQEMDGLQSSGLLVPGTRRDLLNNSLVLIVPAGTSAVSGFASLTGPEVKRVAIADPQGVPAGAYARQVLKYFKLYSRIQPKLIFGGDVRQVLAYVETGNADAGLVYSTDARLSSRVRVVAVAPESSHAPIIYPVAVIKGCKHVAAAKQFVQFLSGPEARQVFERDGFTLAAK
ncbi:MAG: molybdate ABC transporter substrate-binding protein [Terriglobia bacterium]